MWWPLTRSYVEGHHVCPMRGLCCRQCSTRTPQGVDVFLQVTDCLECSTCTRTWVDFCHGANSLQHVFDGGCSIGCSCTCVTRRAPWGALLSRRGRESIVQGAQRNSQTAPMRGKGRGGIVGCHSLEMSLVQLGL